MSQSCRGDPVASALPRDAAPGARVPGIRSRQGTPACEAALRVDAAGHAVAAVRRRSAKAAAVVDGPAGARADALIAAEARRRGAAQQRRASAPAAPLGGEDEGLVAALTVGRARLAWRLAAAAGAVRPRRGVAEARQSSGAAVIGQTTLPVLLAAHGRGALPRGSVARLASRAVEVRAAGLRVPAAPRGAEVVGRAIRAVVARVRCTRVGAALEGTDQLGPTGVGAARAQLPVARHSPRRHCLLPEHDSPSSRLAFG
jgi:hypothetical protein